MSNANRFKGISNGYKLKIFTLLCRYLAELNDLLGFKRWNLP